METHWHISLLRVGGFGEGSKTLLTDYVTTPALGSLHELLLFSLHDICFCFEGGAPDDLERLKTVPWFLQIQGGGRIWTHDPLFSHHFPIRTQGVNCKTSVGW